MSGFRRKAGIGPAVALGLKGMTGGVIGRPDFEVQLTTSIIPARGTGPATFTRATTRTVADHEGKLNTLLSGEVGFQGARRVRNLFATSQTPCSAVSGATDTGGFTDPLGGTTARQIVYGGAGGRYFNDSAGAGDPAGITYTASIWIQFVSGTATFAIVVKDRGTDTIRGTTTITATTTWQRFAVTGTPVAGAGGFRFEVGNNGIANTVLNVAFGMGERVTGQFNQNPGEYVSTGVLSSPWNGANLDGVKYFDKINGNTYQENLSTNSQEVGSWTLSLIQQVNADAGLAPDGTLTADLVIPNTSTGSHFVRPSGVAALTIGQWNTFSFYVKAAGYTLVSAETSTTSQPAGTVGFNVPQFNLATGAVANSTSSCIGSMSPVSGAPGWYRCVVTWIAGATTAPALFFPVYGSGTGDGVSGIYFWGAQVRRGQVPGTYIRAQGANVTSGAIEESTGNSVGATTLAGYLAEEARTNLCLQSQTLDNVTWVKTSGTISADATVAPDGTTTADKFIPDNTIVGASSRLNQSFTATASQPQTMSFWLKAAGQTTLEFQNQGAWAVNETGVLTFTLTGAGSVASSGAKTATITAWPNGWYRCVTTFTSTATPGTPGVQFQQATANTGDGTAGVYIWGVQIEDSKLSATTYIATTTVSVTRNQDQLTYPSAGNAATAAGTLYAEITYADTASYTHYTATVSDTTLNNRVTIFCSQPGAAASMGYRVVSGGVAQLSNAGTLTPSATVANKQALRWSSADATAYLNAAQDRQVTGALTPPAALTTIGIGLAESGSGSQPNSTIRNVRIWKIALNDADMKIITS